MTAETVISEVSTAGVAGTAEATATLNTPRQAVIDKLKSLQPNTPIAIVNGGFGDMEGCDAVLEERVYPPGGGSFMKFLGCSYLFKGFPRREIVESMALAKSMISMLPREILAKSIIFKIGLAILYFFAPKKFWHYIHVYFYTLYLNVVAKSNIPRNYYNKPTEVLRRAVDIAFTKELERGNYYRNTWFHGDIQVINKKEWLEAISCLAEFVYLFLENDNAYRFRIQDVFSLINKKNVKRSVVKEVARIFDILIKREDALHGIGRKWKQLKPIVLLFLIIDRRLRRFAKNVLLELDTEEIALDEHDWYFCLKRRTYNFKGISLKKRLEEKKRIDKEKEHIIPEVLWTIGPDGNKVQVIKIP